MTVNNTFDLQETGCYVSYSNSTSIYGCDTTALVRMDGVNPMKFLILNGNHTKEYRELGNYNDCVKYFKQHSQQKNEKSENWDEEVIIREDGSCHIQKIGENNEKTKVLPWLV